MMYILGDDLPRGTYILKLHINKSITIDYGRSATKNQAYFSEGTYALVGSALGKRGAASLPLRLTRHARRTDNSKHALFVKIVDFYGLDADNISKSKTLHWHSDFLLESEYVNLTDAIIIQDDTELEEQIAEFLIEIEETKIPVKGFASTDTKADSHLIQVPDANQWWSSLITELNQYLREYESIT